MIDNLRSQSVHQHNGVASNANVSPKAETAPTVPQAKPPERTYNEVITAFKPCGILPYPNPDATEGEDPTIYHVTVVTSSSQQENRRCTLEVYRMVENTKPQFEVHSDWILKIHSKKVVDFTRKPRIRQGPLAINLGDYQEKLVLQKSGNRFEPVTFPYKFQTPVLENAIAAMNSAGSVREGDRVDKFSVVKVIENSDNQLVVLDITSPPQ